MFRSILIGLVVVFNLKAQDSLKIKRVLSFQEELNAKFATKETSPLIEEDFTEFETLNFFAIDTLYQVEATFKRTPLETPFIMKTTTDREPVYVKYGEVSFLLQDKEWILNIYQNQELKDQSEYKDHLFIPFTDLTNGEESYAGGRFIDITIPETDQEVMTIDFNTAYNPYCAYNKHYSCPIPPEENHLELKVLAGVRKYNVKSTK